eukprot:sb/3469728/
MNIAINDTLLSAIGILRGRVIFEVVINNHFLKCPLPIGMSIISKKLFCVDEQFGQHHIWASRDTQLHHIWSSSDTQHHIWASRDPLSGTTTSKLLAVVSWILPSLLLMYYVIRHYALQNMPFSYNDRYHLCVPQGSSRLEPIAFLITPILIITAMYLIMIAVILKRRMNATTLLIISSCIVASGTFTTKITPRDTQHHIWASRDIHVDTIVGNSQLLYSILC